MNPRIALLPPYPFERLAELLRGVQPPAELPHIGMGIGEPRHATPALVLEALRANLHQLGTYPATRGLPELRAAMALAIGKRFFDGRAVLDPDTMVLPVNGTREALFSFVQCVVDNTARAPLVVMPNPCYQIYEGAALLSGAEPYYLNTTAQTRFIPAIDSVPDSIWERCQLLFLCSPGNPTGVVLSLEYLRHALELAERFDFVIACDECYIDLHLDEHRPPPSLLEAALASGRTGFERCAVFQSLSKRSSVPGLRSGLVAGDPALLKKYLLYRTYHGCAMPVPTQLASVAAWSDTAHVVENRHLYQQKYERVLPILGQSALNAERPDAGFYLWTDVQCDDVEFARELYRQQNLTVLPGSFMARDTAAGNPGSGMVRISLVAGLQECITAAHRIQDFLS